MHLLWQWLFVCILTEEVFLLKFRCVQDKSAILTAVSSFLFYLGFLVVLVDVAVLG